MSGSRDIEKFYTGKCVFITGATGFIGKVLIEKLLRSCPGIVNIFILMRSKKQNDVTTRFTELLNTPLFDGIRKTHPEFLDKVIPIAGDVTLPGLGISQSDRKLLQDAVSIVFHLAATVRFDDPLEVAINMNILGTKRLVELCREMIKIEALIHVSTAYSNCDRDEVAEVLYPPPADPDLVMKYMECKDEKLLQIITPQLIKKHPNTYTFTKALAEHVFVRESSGIPSAIVRPSIITGSWREPITGWVDSLNGATGILAGAAKGIIQSVLCNGEMIADIIPVDIVVNLMISSGWNTAKTKANNVSIYNCTSSALSPIKWRELEENAISVYTTEPFNDIVWCPSKRLRSSKSMHYIYRIFYHVILPHVIDIVFRILGRKPILVRLHQKIEKPISALEHFCTHEWKFYSSNVLTLYSKLSDYDKNVFYFNVKEVEWTRYIRNYINGMRSFIMKDDPSRADVAKTRLRIMYIVNGSIQILLLILLMLIITPILFKYVF